MKPAKLGSLILKGASKVDDYINQTESARTDWIMRKVKVKPWPKDSFQVPLWQAHRGYWIDGKPQNSMASIAAAREKGAKMVEFDVRVTRDRIPILFHDETFKDGDQVIPVHSLTLRELKDKVPVTKLQEVFASPRAPEFFNVELKSETVLNESMERYVASVVEKYGVHNRVLFSSFNPFSLWKMAQYLPHIPRALLTAPDMKERSLREMWWSLVISIHALHLDHQMISKDKMRQWRSQKVPIAAWTVNDVGRMEELVEWGVFSIITDKIPPLKLRG